MKFDEPDFSEEDDEKAVAIRLLVLPKLCALEDFFFCSVFIISFCAAISSGKLAVAASAAAAWASPWCWSSGLRWAGSPAGSSAERQSPPGHTSVTYPETLNQ